MYLVTNIYASLRSTFSTLFEMGHEIYALFLPPTMMLPAYYSTGDRRERVQVMGQAIWAGISHDHFGTTRIRYVTMVTCVGPARNSSWVVFGLRCKLIGWHKHGPFNVGSVRTVLVTNSPSNRAETCSNLAHNIYKYINMTNSILTFKLFSSSIKKMEKNKQKREK